MLPATTSVLFGDEKPDGTTEDVQWITHEDNNVTVKGATAPKVFPVVYVPPQALPLGEESGGEEGGVQDARELTGGAAAWEFDMGDEVWVRFEAPTSKLLEDAYLKLLVDNTAPSELKFRAGYFRYKADLQSMTQVNLQTETKRAIRRRVISRDEDIDALFE